MPPGGNGGYDCGTPHTPAPGSAVQAEAHRVGSPDATRRTLRSQSGQRVLDRAENYPVLWDSCVHAHWDSPRWARIDRVSPTALAASSFPPSAGLHPGKCRRGRCRSLCLPSWMEGRLGAQEKDRDCSGVAVMPLPFGVSSPPGCLLGRRNGQKAPWCVQHRWTLCSLRPSGPLA